MILIGAIGLIPIYGLTRCGSYYCYDTIPDTSGIYAYAADLKYGQRNQDYSSARGIRPEDENRMIEYRDIPGIAELDGVKKVYVFSDVKLNAFLNGGNPGSGGEDAELVTLSIPHDIYQNFAVPSAADAMFELEIGGAPADGSNGIALPESWLIANGGATIGDKVVFGGKEYTLTGINHYEYAWVPFEEEKSLYYVYDASTWESFNNELSRYLISVDGMSYVNMYIECEEGKTAGVQDQLVKSYPSTNYASAQFTKVIKSDINGKYWSNLIIFAVCVLLAASVVFAVAGRSIKK